MTLLRGVTQHGTGAAAAQLNHPVGGKTGTTSDYTDAWFLGFSPSVTCGVWVGFDSRESLGEKETGAKAALPIWMTFMRAAIAGKPDEQFPGEDESDQLKAESRQPTNAQPAQLASTKPAQPAVAGKPAIVPPAPASGALAPVKVQVQPGAKPVAKLTEATDETPRVKPALASQPQTANPRGSVKPAIDGLHERPATRLLSRKSVLKTERAGSFRPGITKIKSRGVSRDIRSAVKASSFNRTVSRNL
jgi:penicillin-binding protein 1A